ncbi:MAG: NADH-quinone oxidoreductase subunit C [Nitrososphaeria archaeon]|nr:NADH-quinone oxidoreductase subunit C [Nitrososphaeria archaeon]NIN51997.1 NADH-quinone oxidoreductase subunit C [Nitrososphaeria archaeon]NIQ32458.1 NADH-quinone oxidoreductase subunit C [Nitrososphaeria archaeon]
MTTKRSIEELIKEIQPLSLQTSVEDEKRIIVEYDSERILELAAKLKSMGFDHVKSVTGTDYPQKDVMTVTYHSSSYGNPELVEVIVTLKTSIERSHPKHPSLVNIWPSAEYLERETYELVGISFEGHPRLSRLLLPPDYEGPPPLRRDFEIPVEGIEA